MTKNEMFKHTVQELLPRQSGCTQPEEVFIPCDCLHDARFVHQMNSGDAKQAIRDRWKTIEVNGEYREVFIPELPPETYGPEPTTVSLKKVHVEVENFELKLDNKVGHVKLNGRCLQNVRRVILDCTAHESAILTVEFVLPDK